uniref:Uncharacterized protein n=1 Tax=Ciona intestinalis TaxID=7719 RepID=H2Y3I4_CIOIN
VLPLKQPVLFPEILFKSDNGTPVVVLSSSSQFADTRFLLRRILMTDFNDLMSAFDVGVIFVDISLLSFLTARFDYFFLY